MKRNLPQANNLDKVIDVVIYVYNNPGCELEDIAEYIGFTTRQARYYYDACKYLELVTDDHTVTPSCLEMLKKNRENLMECIYERILLDELMGQVFVKAFLFPDSDIEKFAQELVSVYHPEIIGSTTFQRRAHVAVLWCKRIIKYVTTKHN